MTVRFDYDFNTALAYQKISEILPWFVIRQFDQLGCQT